MLDGNRSEKLSYFGVITAIVLGLYLSCLYSYLLFHSLIEVITIAVAFTLFILTWNTRRYLANDYLRLLGIGYAFIALIDLLHTLAYKGMNVFPGYGANLPTQLWIAARYLQAVTLFAAPFFVERRVDNRALAGGYAVAVSVLVAMVYSGNFPDCYIEGNGLTAFKIGSEYAITALLLISLYLLYRKRTHFNDRVFFLTASSIACTALAEISFTAYLSVYGFANMAGHFSRLAAFYLIYRAILVTGLKDPFDLIFRDLKQAEEALRKAHDTLEEKVRERTAELRASEEKYRALIESANDAVFLHEIKEGGIPGPFIEVNELACRQLGYSREEFAGLSPMELDDPQYRDRIAEAMERLLKNGHAVFETAQIAKDGRSIPVEVSTRVIEIGGKRLLFSLVRDIAERKLAEETLHRLNRELRAISNCNQTLIRAEDEQTLLNDICRIVCEEAGYRMAWVGYAENDDAKTIRPVAWAGAEDGYLEQAGLTWGDTERGHGPSGTAIVSGESACIQDFTTAPQAASWRDSALQRGYRSSVAIPLKDQNANTFGILNIYSAKPNAFTSDEIRLMEELAGDLAFGIMILRTRIERERAEQKTRELSAIVQSSGDAIIGKNLDGIITSWNRGAESIYGYTETEVAGKSVAILIPPGCEDDLPWMLGRIKSGEYVNHHETVRRTKDGRDIPVSLTVSPVRDSEGRIVAVSTIARDVTERKRVEEALQFRNVLLSTQQEASIDGILVVDENARILSYNRRFVEMWGLSAKLVEDGVDEPVLQFVTAQTADPRSFLQRVQYLYEHRQETSRDELILADGRVFDRYSAPIFGSGDRYYGRVWYFRDITERKRAEEALYEQQQVFRTLVENSPDIIARYDRNCRRTYVNPAYLKEAQIPLQRLIATSPIERSPLPTTSAVVLQNLLRRVLDSGAAEAVDVIFPKADNIDCWYNIYASPEFDREGRIVSVLTVSRDITERKRAEQKLKESLTREQFLGDIIRNASVGIKIGYPNGAIVPLNTAIMDITGYAAEELNTDWGNLITSPEWREYEQGCLAELKRTGKPVTYEKEYIRKDGSRVPVQLVVHGIFDAGGSLEQYIAFVTDITGRKAAEDERRSFEAKIRQAQKMEAIGTLAGGIAHDFNNILSAIMGYTELAINEIPEESPPHSFLQQVLKGAARAADLVRQILTFSRQTEKEYRPVFVNPIIKEALKLLRASLPTTIEIRPKLTASSQRMVIADPTQIHQVIMNLCANAAHAMRERGGILEVELSEVDVGEPDRLFPLQLEPGAYLRLKVSDTGHGMDEDTMQRIFDPFFTTKPRDEGTGMGLAVVHGIVESCGGAITVQSKPGEGSEFCLFFPVAASVAPEYRTESEDAPAGKGCILFVDDEEPLVELGRVVLEGLGYRVVGKTGSLEALEVFRSAPDQFDLVVTDLTMPRMTGVDLAKQILQIRADTPIILCTGYNELLDGKSITELGFRELVNKPILRHIMAQAIDRSLRPK